MYMGYNEKVTVEINLRMIHKSEVRYIKTSTGNYGINERG